MPCHTPLQGFQTLKDGIVFSRRHPLITHPVTVPCGQCIGCRLERSRQWAVRCVHEGQMHDENCFVTLTYDDENLPFGETLHKPDWVKFMKRLRKKLAPQKVRFYQCGEYGETTDRPHYHACMFGYRPDDPELFSTQGEIKLYESPKLRKIWGLGHVTFGEMTFETAAYCSRYCLNKITGPPAENHYQRIDVETGEIYDRLPEYSNSSRRPGIGLPWLEKYGADAYEKDEVILRAKAMKPPRAYDKVFEHTDPQTWKRVKFKRIRDALAKPQDERDGTFNKYLAQTAIAKAKLQPREPKT